MGTLVDLRDSLTEFDIQRESLAAISRTAEKYVDLNREQLLEGRRADKTRMPNYSYISVKFYGKPEGPIRLYDTGAFQESFKLDVGSEDLELVADDIHGLEERFGNEIYGLATENQEYYNQDIFLPELADAIETKTGLVLN
ncbi:MAG: hypothetical protein FD166_3613 [Bacteroidetes bacterium]|nr:MAG: hypothetical protein FD166_3613 [Bacteroidota bacterium]